MTFISRFPLVQPETDQHSAAANWSEAVEVRYGESLQMLFISGVVPSVHNESARRGTVERYGSMEQQTHSVLAELKALLDRHNYEFSCLVKLTCFMVEGPPGSLDLEGFGKAYRDYFDDAHLPARSRVVVSRLMDPGWLVEVEGIGVKNPARESSP